jgi:hypothetical protein
MSLAEMTRIFVLVCLSVNVTCRSRPRSVIPSACQRGSWALWAGSSGDDQWLIKEKLFGLKLGYLMSIDAFALVPFIPLKALEQIELFKEKFGEAAQNVRDPLWLKFAPLPGDRAGEGST